MFQKTRKRVEEEENCPLRSLCLPVSLPAACSLACSGWDGRVGVGAKQRLEEEEEGILFPTDRSLFRVQKSREGRRGREGGQQ